MKPGYIRFSLKYQHFRRKGYSEYHAGLAARGKKQAKFELAHKRAELEKHKQELITACEGVQRPRIAVLGCAKKEYIRGQKKIFERILGRKVDLVTFDITIKHLGRPSKNLIEHDCTKRLPGTAYDIVYSHILLEFLTPKQQEKMIVNATKSLAKSGVAIHMHTSKQENKRYIKVGYPMYLVDIAHLRILAKKTVTHSQKVIFDQSTFTSGVTKKKHPQNRLIQEVLFWTHMFVIIGFLFIGLIIPLPILVIMIIVWNLQLLFLDRCILTLWQEKVGGVDQDQAFMQQAYKRFTGKHLSTERVDQLLTLIPTVTLTIAVIADLTGNVLIKL